MSESSNEGSRSDRDHGSLEVGPLVDYWFSLANERTFLAWTRTSLALIAGGVAVLHLLADSATGFVAAYVLVGMGVLVSLTGLRRWIRNDRAMLHGLPWTRRAFRSSW